MGSRQSEVVEVEVEPGVKKRFKIVETAVDPPLTVKRQLVPIETTDDDIPVGSRLLDERETDGFLARSGRPEKFLVGEPVRLKPVGEITEELGKPGIIDAKLKTGKLRVKWEAGGSSTHESKELTHIW